MLTPDDIWKANAALHRRLHPKKTGRKNNHPESDFQKSIIQLAALEYPEAEVIAIPNRTNTRMVKTKTGRWISIEGKRLKEEGQRAGAGDLLWLWRDLYGQRDYGFMEVKWDSSQSDEQKLFETAVLKVGGRYEICRRELNRVHEICKIWGVPRRTVR